MMAQLRKKPLQLKFVKDSDWILNEIVNKTDNTKYNMQKNDYQLTEDVPIDLYANKEKIFNGQNGNNIDEESASLNWLVNLSAASIFPSPAPNEMQKPFSNDLEYNEVSVNTKPAFTYTELIEKALKEKGELTVSEIYKWIYSKYPYYKKNDGRWKNSIRHNLSINPQFRKGNKCTNGGHYWTLNKEYDDEFKKWQELRKEAREDRKRKAIELKDDEELERATQTILLDRDDNNDLQLDEEFTPSGKYISDDYSTAFESNEPSLAHVENGTVTISEKEVEGEYLNETNKGVSAPLVVEEDLFEISDPILTDPLLFSDCLELGFQPYELIDSRL